MSIDLKPYPISIKHLQHIIDRIHNRYPLITKQEISIIVRSFFELLRSVIISGNIITIHNLFSSMKLYNFNKIRKNKLVNSIKIQLATPRKFKNG